jgi:hypothetical protein
VRNMRHATSLVQVWNQLHEVANFPISSSPSPPTTSAHVCLLSRSLTCFLTRFLTRFVAFLHHRNSVIDRAPTRAQHSLPHHSATSRARARARAARPRLEDSGGLITPHSLAPHRPRTMVTQRRYSIPGQTSPEDVEAVKTQALTLETTVPSTSCGFGESKAESSRGRQMAPSGTIVRTSSKRSATQWPSPSHELPPKIARYRMGLTDVGMDTDSDTESDTTGRFYDYDQEWDVAPYESQPTSVPPSPELSQLLSTGGLPDAPTLEKLHLSAAEASDDEAMDAESLALSLPPSRNHSIDLTQLNAKAMEQEVDAYKRAVLDPVTEILHFENIDAPTPDQPHVPPTFLTLPPEIRHKIYPYCDRLVFDKPLLYCIATAFDKIQHPLASVSRQVRREALAIFYGQNVWIIKVEFRMMYDSFQSWIIRLGDGAGHLRRVELSVRGTMFAPAKRPTPNAAAHGYHMPTLTKSCYPPDGDASFRIDLSEKYTKGRVQLLRNDGTRENGEQARARLETMVEGLWDKRKAGTLNGQDWVTTVDTFITFIGGW